MDNLPRPPFFAPPQDPGHRPHQIPDMHIADRHLGRLAPLHRGIDGGAGEPQFPVAGPVFQQHGGIPVLLVFEQPLHQILPVHLHRFLDLFRPGHQCPGLDLQQHAGEFDKLPHLIDRQILEHRQMGDEFAGDLGDRNLGDVDLVPLHEIEEQVHRPGKDVGCYLEFHGPVSTGAGRPAGLTQSHLPRPGGGCQC